MKRHWIIWTGMIMLAGSIGVAGADEPQQLEEVVVTAARAPQPKAKVTKSVSTVMSTDIEHQHATTVLDAVRNVPGVFVRQSGALGRTTAVVIRGSLDRQVLTLLDGVDMSSPTLGSFNFATWPTDFLERVEVLRGSAGALYGSKAIGGVVNMRTNHGEGPPRTTYKQEFGTLRTFRETLMHQATYGPAHYHVGINRLDSRGFRHHHVRATHVAAAGGAQLTRWLGWDVALNNNDSHVFIDDGAFKPDPNRFLRHEELALSTALTATPLEAWQQELRFIYHHDDTLDVDVADPGTTQKTTDSRIDTNRYGVDWLHRLNLGWVGLLTAGFEFRNDGAESTRFTKSVYQWDWFLQHQVDVFQRLTLLGGVRATHHKTFGSHTVADASAAYQIPVIETKLRGSFSQGFRAPTLNELYFPNFGDPDINPETSRSFEIGVGRDWWDHRLGGEVTYFHTRVQNLIQFVTDTSGSSHVQNINTALMEGVELESHLRPGWGLDIAGTWTYTHTRDVSTKDELVRSPANKIGLTVDYAFLKRWHLNVRSTFVSHQEDNSNTQRVKQYDLVNAALTCQVTKNLQLYGRIENLFDRRYSEVLGFPAAGTLFFIGGQLEF